MLEHSCPTEPILVRFLAGKRANLSKSHPKMIPENIERDLLSYCYLIFGLANLSVSNVDALIFIINFCLLNIVSNIYAVPSTQGQVDFSFRKSRAIIVSRGLMSACAS